MVVHLLTSAEPVIVAAALAITAVSAVLRKWIEEKFRTERLGMSIEGAQPSERSPIIRACGDLEAKSHSERHDAGRDRPADLEASDHPDGHHRPGCCP